MIKLEESSWLLFQLFVSTWGLLNTSCNSSIGFNCASAAFFALSIQVLKALEGFVKLFLRQVVELTLALARQIRLSIYTQNLHPIVEQPAVAVAIVASQLVQAVVYADIQLEMLSQVEIRKSDAYLILDSRVSPVELAATCLVG
ncbi:MAG: hypothetical protein WDO19_21795 [Bacteroidota bacterium]